MKRSLFVVKGMIIIPPNKHVMQAPRVSECYEKETKTVEDIISYCILNDCIKFATQNDSNTF